MKTERHVERKKQNTSNSIICYSLLLMLFIPFTISAQEKVSGPEINTSDPMKIKPTGPKPDWAPEIDEQMQAVIEQLQSFENPKPSEMSAFQFRMAKTPTEAVQALLKKTGMKAKELKVEIAHKVLPVGPDEGVLVRIYTPVNRNSSSLPVIVYYHGGGWVIADLDTYEASAIALSEQAGAIVVSVAYRQAPEHEFPAAHDDAFAAYKWVVENAASLGGDATKIASAGESAGGNLAVAVAIMARQQNVQLPVHILSVYPIADGDVESPSYKQYAEAKPLNKGLMEWFFDKYQPQWKTDQEPLIALIDADLSGLPPTTIINAEIDPLQYEGGELEEKLRMAGVDVKRELYSGVTHEFFGMAAVLEQAVEAQKFAVKRLKESF